MVSTGAARMRRRCAGGLLAAALLVVGAGCGQPATPPAPRSPTEWTAPSLQDPTHVTLSSDDAHARLESGRDYVVELSEAIEAVGGVTISGGRNVVLDGGRITIPDAGPGAAPADRRGLFLRWQSGIVHVENLVIDNAGGDLSEGIQINAPHAVVQLVDVRIDTVHARDRQDFSDNHPDLIQPWGGVRELRVQRFTGCTGYQGIFLKGDQGDIGRAVLRDSNIIGVEGARYLLWATPDVEVEVDNVWVQPAPGRSARVSVRPELPDEPWRSVHVGRPPAGDFVPAAGGPHDDTTPDGCRYDTPPLHAG